LWMTISSHSPRAAVLRARSCSASFGPSARPSPSDSIHSRRTGPTQLRLPPPPARYRRRRHGQTRGTMGAAAGIFSPRERSRVLTHLHAHRKMGEETRRERAASLPLLADPTHDWSHKSLARFKEKKVQKKLQ
jgi:hypothetical protein